MLNTGTGERERESERASERERESERECERESESARERAGEQHITSSTLYIIINAPSIYQLRYILQLNVPQHSVKVVSVFCVCLCMCVFVRVLLTLHDSSEHYTVRQCVVVVWDDHTPSHMGTRRSRLHRVLQTRPRRLWFPHGLNVLSINCP